MIAQFVETEVLPSCCCSEVTSIVLGGRSGVAYTTLVRRFRKASARIELVAWCDTSAKAPWPPEGPTPSKWAWSAERVGTSPRVGTRSMVSISRGSRMLVSRYSKRNARITPPTSPTRHPIIRLSPVRGPERLTGTSARSTTEMFESSSEEETCVSLSRVDRAA